MKTKRDPMKYGPLTDDDPRFPMADRDEVTRLLFLAIRAMDEGKPNTSIEFIYMAQAKAEGMMK